MAAVVVIDESRKNYDFNFFLSDTLSVRLNRKAEDTVQAFFGRLCAKVPEAQNSTFCFLRGNGDLSNSTVLLSSEDASSEVMAQPLGPLTEQSTHILLAQKMIPLIKNPGVPSNVGFGHIPLVGIPYFLSITPSQVIPQIRIEWYTADVDSIPRAPKRAKQSLWGSSPAAPASAPGSPTGPNGEGVARPYSPFVSAVVADDLACLQTNMMGFGKSDAALFGRKRGEGLIFTPTEEDLGKILLVRISPKECFPFFMQLACSVPVQPTVRRAAWYQERSVLLNSHLKPPGTIRVLSWNILAPAYTGSAYAKELLFPFCDYAFLDFKYRRGLIAKELLEAKADIWCLQECGEEVLNDLLIPLATHLGMDCSYALKFGKAKEGVLIAYRSDLWELVECHQPLFKDILVMDPELGPLREELQKLWPDFVDRIVTAISSVYLICVLRDKKSGQLNLVANTHLYYHPNASHIRALQSYILLLIIDRVRRQLKVSCPDNRDIKIIIAGDLNSSVETGAIELITKGKIPANHPTWEYAPKFGTRSTRPPATEESALEVTPAVTPASLPLVIASTGPRLISPLGIEMRVTQKPGQDLEFTTHVGQFQAILDWIFVSKNIQPRWGLRGPPLTAIQHEPGQTIGESEGVKPGLPTAGYPSDHISVITDLAL